jgi:hypothetical protein
MRSRHAVHLRVIQGGVKMGKTSPLTNIYMDFWEDRVEDVLFS